MATDEEESKNVVVVLGVIEAGNEARFALVGLARRWLARPLIEPGVPLQSPLRVEGGVATDEDQPRRQIVRMARSSLAPRWLSSLVLCLAAAGCSSEPASPAEAAAQIALPIAKEKPAPADALWSPAAMPFFPVRLHTAALLQNGQVLIVGGVGDGGYTVDYQISPLYDPPTNTWLGKPVCCNTTCAEGPCDACAVALGAVADGTCALVEGAACPGGVCSAGACSLSADGEIGGASASSTSSSASSVGGATSSGVTGAGGGASSSVGGAGGGASSGVTGAGGSSNSSGPSGGSGCRMATGDQEPSPAWLLFAAAVVVLRRRRDGDDRQSGSRPGGA